MKNKRNEKGSIELIVLGLLATLIVLIALPAIIRIGNTTSNALTNTASCMEDPNGPGCPTPSPT